MPDPAFTLANRAALRRAFYRLTGTAADDDQLTEHDSEALEAVHYYLHRGLWSAQEYLLTAGGARRWVTAASLSWATDADGFGYADLPDDFLRLAGDERRGALTSSGTQWGSLIDVRERFAAGPTNYWIDGERLYAGKGVSIPSGLAVSYHYRHPVITSDDETTEAGAIDFPLLDRPLIVAFAGVHASSDSWLPGGAEMEARIEKALALAKAEASRRARRTGEPRKLRPPDTIGTHWI